ncbi:PREDICTED: putative gustatory receptor 28b [Trachymyrmex septentrionalis]|uniref:putative gustatory receptor 28b n=1 Tax=Trachymyrmex septentrionalis TaxID=34720 RepID=UPI00084F55B5|nr:PREDICTED: putative gustatory receptor 28b [Trachymyrmex septentrionalis]
MWKKWQLLFHATDFQSLMYPCFTFSSVLGIFPYKINGLTFETSKQRYILAIFILGIFSIYVLVVLYEINIAGTIDVGNVPKALERNSLYISANFMAVVAYVLSGSRMNLLQTIMNVSSKLPLNTYGKLSKLIHAKDILGFFLLIIIEVFYCTRLNFTWYKVPVLYINLMAFQMDMLYMNCVCILKACFKRIDDNLVNLRELVINDEPHLLRRIYHEHKNAFLLMEFKALKKQHLAISDTVQMLNTVFSLHILASIIITFSQLTFHLYYYITEWRFSVSENSTFDLFFHVSLMVHTTIHCIKIILIVWACETGKDRAVKIGITVHDLLNNTSDKEITEELQLFSVQILHRKNVFSAKGLIMDVTLLIAIVSNVSTYLLILVQFFITCIKITLMGWACDTSKDEAMGIGTTVHKILNDTIDEQIKDELQLFSLQVLQRENTFSAKGLIVDATLLVGINSE